MIKVNHGDTLIDIIDSIQKETGKDIILDFPAGHSILHNYISLKILKTKSWEKNLIITTSDILASKIWKKLGIKYTLIKDKDFIEKKSIQSDYMQHNFSFLEYLRFEIKRYYRESINFIKRNKKINTITYYSKKYQKSSGIWYFIIGLWVSISIFFFIFYFAINKTTITISPEVEVKKSSRNFIFKENIDSVLLKDNKYIKIESIESQISLLENYIPTEINPESSSKASWKIEFINLFPEEVNLVPETRLITEDGLLFQINSWVKIPAAVVDNFWNTTPGKIESVIESQFFDTQWAYIGTRWNIKIGTPFSLPGLVWEDSDKIYAISIDDFTGWEDNFQRKISAEDVENAKKKIEQKLKSTIARQLNQQLEERNTRDKTNLWILMVDGITDYSGMEINMSGGKEIGDITENFSLSWTIIWKTYVFDRTEVVNKLKTIVRENTLEWIQSVLLIDESSLQISHVIYNNDSPLEIKATIEINAFVSHDFLSKNNSYTEKLKSTVRSIPKEEATKLLINDPKISNVTIDIRPFFLNKISNIPENIIFNVRDS